MPITAWGDESIRVHAAEPTYLIGACILGNDALESIEKIKRIVPKGAKKIHWRDMGNRTQKQALEIIAQAPQTTCIVVATPMNPKRQERSRRKCLEKLLLYLEERAVTTLILESRDSYLDKKDIDFLLYLRRCGVVKDIDIQHRGGSADPFLCMPDQILGAYGELVANEGMKPPTWIDVWNKIAESVETISVSV